VGPHSIVVARRELGRRDRSCELSVNARTSKASESTDGDLSTAGAPIPTDYCRLCSCCGGNGHKA
ncbi:hypothetical protein AVEN_145917-1, partial [Araneus ventricosus]